MEPEQDPLESTSKNFIKNWDKDIEPFREESWKQLRKSIRADFVMKNRNLYQPSKQWVNLDEIYKATYTITDMPDLLKAMHSSSVDQYLMAAQGFRKILTSKNLLAMQEVIDAKVLPFLIKCIRKFEYPQLQYEAVWAITYISSGITNCKIIADIGGIPMLVQLMISRNEDIREKAVCALGNMTENSKCCRDLIFKNQGLPLVIECLKNSQRHLMIEYSCKAISYLLQERVHIYVDVKDAALVLADVIKTQQDVKILRYSLNAFSYFSLLGNKPIDTLIETGVVSRVIQLLNHHEYNVQISAFKIIDNMIEGNNKQTQLVLNLGCVEALSVSMSSSVENIIEKATLSISKICAGSDHQLDKIITTGLMPRLVDLAFSSNEDIKFNIAYALGNAAGKARPDQLAYFVKSGIIQAFCNLLQDQNEKTYLITMLGIESILKYAKKQFNDDKELCEFLSIIEQCNGLVNLKLLIKHTNNWISVLSRKIIEKYFKIDIDEVKLDGLFL